MSTDLTRGNFKLSNYQNIDFFLTPNFMRQLKATYGTVFCISVAQKSSHNVGCPV